MRLQQQHEKDEYVVKTMRWTSDKTTYTKPRGFKLECLTKGILDTWYQLRVWT